MSKTKKKSKKRKTKKSSAFGSNAVDGVCLPCQGGMKDVTVTIRPLELTFRNDHKLLRKVKPERVKLYAPHPTQTMPNGKPVWVFRSQIDSKWGGKAGGNLKPEWKQGAEDNEHRPASYSKNEKVVIDLKVEVTVRPKGKGAILKEIVGVMNGDSTALNWWGTDARWTDPTKLGPQFEFKKALNRGVQGQEVVEIKGIKTDTPLPNCVAVLRNLHVSWFVHVAQQKEWIRFRTGPHKIYVTFSKPKGSVKHAGRRGLVEDGATQTVTAERLEWACTAAHGLGFYNEQECVDAVFLELMRRGVGYSLGARWSPGGNDTYVRPKPQLQHYLWLCNAHLARGECHNIAAGLVLACKILGVQGPFQVGYMFPWSRHEPGSNGLMGKYNVPCMRSHASASHPTEFLVFYDGRANGNNFEGVAKYGSAALYAIGDFCFSRTGDPHQNASDYFAEVDKKERDKVKHLAPPAWGHGPGRILEQNATWQMKWHAVASKTRGAFRLAFDIYPLGLPCDKPYPWIPEDPRPMVDYSQPVFDPATGTRKYRAVSAGFWFKWHEPPVEPVRNSDV